MIVTFGEKKMLELGNQASQYKETQTKQDIDLSPRM